MNTSLTEAQLEELRSWGFTHKFYEECEKKEIFFDNERHRGENVSLEDILTSKEADFRNHENGAALFDLLVRSGG